MEKVKKRKSFTRSYRPVVIWLEDLEEIVATLQETTKDVQISTDDYRFTTVDEVKEHFGPKTQFAMEITSSAPYLRLQLTRLWVELYVSPDPQSAKLFHEIDGVLSRCQRSVFYRYWLIVPSMVALYSDFVFPKVPATVVITGLGTVGAFWFLCVCFVTMSRCAVIYLQRRSESSPFFERTKDQLLLLLIGGLLGGVITFAGVVLKERFYPSAPTVNAPTQP